MKKPPLLPIVLLPALLCLPPPALAETTNADTDGAQPGAKRRVELVRMVRQDCGSCHGMTLKGGLGSPLLPENLRDKPADGLVATIMQGRPGTAMPPWQAIISEAEAEWIVARLLTGFPQE
ncbi:c-type cytochrome [Sterolibacterium denitrificans]|nr:cytochrome c [Sterolibacterium denitrificans]